MPGYDNRPQGSHFSSDSAPKPQTARRAAAPADGQQRRPQGRTLQTASSQGRAPQSAYANPYANLYGDDPKRRRKNLGIAVGVVLAVLLVVGGFMGFTLYRDAKDVRATSKVVIENAKKLKDNLKDGDGQALVSNAQEIAWDVAEMKKKVNTPVWVVASFVPVLGDDVRLARNLMDEADNLAQNALIPACEDLKDFKLGNLLHDGAVDLELLGTLVTTLQDVEPVVTEGAAAIAALPDVHIGKVNELVSKVKDPMEKAADAVVQFNQLAPLLPRMFGSKGARNYLITAENNAEIRTQGGFAGALGVMTIDQGVITLNEFEGTLTMGDEGPTSAITISDEEMKLFQPEAQTMNFTSGDSYFTPDFPRGAQLVSTLWSLKHGGQHIDGVVAIDPVFLQYMLQLTGGITAADGMQVDGSNAAAALLSQTYWNYPEDGKMQDAVFSSVAKGAFHKLLGGLGDVGFQRLAAVIMRGADEGRLLMWMANEEEEAAITMMGMDGALPTSADNPQTGLYVNNYSYSKLDWYLNIDTQMSDPIDQGDGTTVYEITATLTNELPADQVANLPAYVKAHSPYADNPAQEMLRLYLYAPYGGSIFNVTCSAGDMGEATHNGLQVMYRDIRLLPGESATVTYMVTVPAEAKGDLELRVTPTAQYARKGTAGDATKMGTVQGEPTAESTAE